MQGVQKQVAFLLLYLQNQKLGYNLNSDGPMIRTDSTVVWEEDLDMSGWQSGSKIESTNDSVVVLQHHQNMLGIMELRL